MSRDYFTEQVDLARHIAAEHGPDRLRGAADAEVVAWAQRWMDRELAFREQLSRAMREAWAQVMDYAPKDKA
ncbi:hypothetical protein BMW26_07865 [Microbacterium sp. 1.5R]|uniref:hypothetical protein n=1 Tax=Microbacterium sp. 1.5R TaxID=1916917 RepID=UPI00090B43DB|nr:hypothetical protein [Microbacterium sp. 1.5R]APH44882.1 hypothetical protein BMW26_07865 [Microbacterium sp. 1.5R]